MKNNFLLIIFLISLSFKLCMAQNKISQLPPIYFTILKNDELTKLKKKAIENIAKKWNVNILESNLESGNFTYEHVIYKEGAPICIAQPGNGKNTISEPYAYKVGKYYLRDFSYEVEEEWGKIVIKNFEEKAKKDVSFGNGLSTTIKNPAHAQDALQKGLETVSLDGIDRNNYDFKLIASQPIEIYQKYNAIFFKIYSKNQEDKAQYYIALYQHFKDDEYLFRIYAWFYSQ